MGEIYLWEEVEEIMEQANRHQAHAPGMLIATREKKEEGPLSFSFRRLCNDSSLFNDFGHFIAKDEGYSGGDNRWKLDAKLFKVNKESTHIWDYCYSA